jgi:purine-nucleoside phosphorylase
VANLGRRVSELVHGAAGVAGAAEAAAAAAVIRDRLQVREPVAAIVLGSGLGPAANRITSARSLAYSEIPGFLPTTVLGHAGRLIAGTLGGREVIAFAGRFHMYEGHAARVSAFPIRVARALGARVALASNAAGGLRPTLKPGDLVLIEDHINLAWQNPLTGAVEPGDARFPDMSAPYSKRINQLARDAAQEEGVALLGGVYVGLLGPTYETPAETRMLATMGADVTGMSTVAEAIVAAAIGMEFAAISLVTNLAAGLSDETLTHDDVVNAAAAAGDGFGRLLEAMVRKL